MPCYHPKKGFPVGLTEKGKVRYKITSWDVTYVTIDTDRDYLITTHRGDPPEKPPRESLIIQTDYVQIPCGKCVGCRLEYARQWTARLQCEAQLHPAASSWFLTLTYDPEKMPLECIVKDGADPKTGEHKDYLTLVPDHVTRFIKRLREAIKSQLEHEEKLVYFLAGEYGNRSQRPHYHMICFELPIPAEWLMPYKRNALGDLMYTCPWLERIWSYGFVVLGQVTNDSIGYTARYCLKKVKDGMREDSTHRYPEYTRMSRKPGIGKLWLDEHPEVADIPFLVIPNREGHNQYPLPRYFLERLPEPSRERLKEVRRMAGKIQQENKSFNRAYSEVLQSEELVKLAQIRSLKRS